MTDLTAGSRDAVVLREALRQALSWWEAGQILHGDAMFEREAEEFDWCRSLLGLPPLNKAADQHFSGPTNSDTANALIEATQHSALCTVGHCVSWCGEADPTKAMLRVRDGDDEYDEEEAKRALRGLPEAYSAKQEGE